jgi:hypothetical protein
MGERRSLKEGKKRLVDQLRTGWNSLLSWLREVQVWAQQAAGAVG